MELLAYGALALGAGWWVRRLYLRRHSPQTLGWEIGRGLVLALTVVTPLLHALELFEDAQRAKAAWTQAHAWCSDDSAARSTVDGWRHTSTFCVDAAGHSRWVLSVWLEFVRHRGLVGLYLGPNAGEILDALANQNWGVVAMKVALVVLLPLGLVAAYIARFRSVEPYRRGDKLCWKMPGRDEVCVCVHDT